MVLESESLTLLSEEVLAVIKYGQSSKTYP